MATIYGSALVVVNFDQIPLSMEIDKPGCRTRARAPAPRIRLFNIRHRIIHTTSYYLPRILKLGMLSRTEHSRELNPWRLN
jgi:hypothetical protein